MFAGLISHVDHVLSDGLGRLIPADALPFVARLLTYALQGILIAIRMIESLYT